MGVQYNKQTISGGFASTAQIQDAENQTEASFADALSRTASGTGSNAMEADLDMNGNDILNARTINGQSITAASIIINETVITGAGETDATANYDWTGLHTFTQTPTVNGFDVVTSENLASQTISINTQTGTTYTTQLTDAGNVILMNNALANTVTIPLNSSVAYPVGSVLSVCQYGAGATTLAPEVGVTLNTEVGYNIISQYGFATLLKIATDEWLLSGSLQA